VVKAGFPGGPIMGRQRQILYLAPVQQAQGFDIAIMTDAEGLFAEACRKQGLPVIIVPAFVLPVEISFMKGGTHGEAKAEYSNLCATLIRKLMEFRPHLIHCHDEMPAYSAMAAGNDMNIPCLLTPHMRIRDNPLLPHLWADRKFAILCSWKSIFQQLKENGIPESKLYYVPSGTAPCANPCAVFDQKPKLMVVGRISDDKGIDSALLAMVELRRRRGRECPALDIYGDGPLLEYYKETNSIIGLDDIVKFHGVRSDIIRNCPGSNIFVMSSPAESGPLVLLEAMSRGMPIVSSDVGDVAEMIPDRRYGRIVPGCSIAMLADAIEATLADIASSRFDPTLSIERHRDIYTVEKMAEGALSVYTKVQTGEGRY
jgi:glycosyltransferase involved in cell wall biosynthesis